MIYFVGLCYAELTTAMPKCGGEHVFSYKAFGSIGAYICTWSIILSYIGVVCYEAVSFPTILQYVFPKIARGYLYSVGGFDIYFYMAAYCNWNGAVNSIPQYYWNEESCKISENINLCNCGSRNRTGCRSCIFGKT